MPTVIHGAEECPLCGEELSLTRKDLESLVLCPRCKNMFHWDTEHQLLMMLPPATKGKTLSMRGYVVAALRLAAFGSMFFGFMYGLLYISDFLGIDLSDYADEY